MNCENHGASTYVSVADDTCCSNCFRPIVKVDTTPKPPQYSILETQHEYVVMSDETRVKGFSKLGDDYAHTNARMLLKIKDSSNKEE